MNKYFLWIGVFLLKSTIAFATDDVKTKPDFYYLRSDEIVSSVKLLPPPPEIDSIVFLNDKAQYEKGKLLRKTVRGQQAIHDAKITEDGVSQAFSEAFTFAISKEKTPEIYRLLQNFREDVGDLSTREAKNAYMRMRPFAYFAESTCTPEDEEGLSKNGSYPSGHTAIGWATALVLVEIDPKRQNEIMRRGYEMGQSRVICGYHWQSDIDAGRTVSSVVVATLHSNPKFIIQLNKAKEEFKKLTASHK